MPNCSGSNGLSCREVFDAWIASRGSPDVKANDLFYWPPGHNVKVDADAEIIMFSPQHEHSAVIDHMIEKTKA